MPANLENSAVTQQWPQDWEGQFSVQFERKAIPKNAQTTAQLHSSHMLVKYCLKFSKPKEKNSQSQTSAIHEPWTPHVQAGFRKGRGTRDQISNTQWIIKKAREFQNNTYFCFTDCAKAFDCVGHNKVWKLLQERGIPDHLTCLLRNPYAGQETTVRTGYGTTDWFQIWKEYVKAVYCHPAYLTYM